MYRSSEMRRLGDFVVRIDSVRAPASVAGGDSIAIQLFARVAGDSCFVWIIGSTYGARRADITVWGRHGPPPGECHPLHRQTIRFAVGRDDSAGEEVFHVVARQPGGSWIDREVVVRRGRAP